MSVRSLIFTTFIGLNILVAILGLTISIYYFLWLIITVPLLYFAVVHSNQKRHAILRNYPVVGLFRYAFESIRPELRQYFWESDTDGTPFNRRQRSIVYQRAKNERETVAFGMQTDPNQIGNEWVAHSVFPVKIEDKDLRTDVGNTQCAQPYSMSVFNISAMSYGALSKTAISSLNKGAKLGNFAHNTGEGGISNFHLLGGDLIWQIGTGYFGCRNEQGNFDGGLFQKNASRPEVKMIELKLSQGAKPGHGGILPAAKNTPEIAAIRHVTPGTDVMSPPWHSAFGTPVEMMHFIGQLRELSGGKPVGFKICIGNKQEFIDICHAITTTQVIPDFITIDGAEGGTGAAPLEFTDSIGMPLFDALTFVVKTLISFGIKKEIKIIVAGRIITGFDLLKVIALGADACYSARGMMFALGCIQALQCDSGKCPVGIATQDAKLYKGLDVTDKSVRVANFHRNTMKAVAEFIGACGFEEPHQMTPDVLFRKTDKYKNESFGDMYFNKKSKAI